MTALQDDQLASVRVHEWALPTDPDEFLAWLGDTSPEVFLTYPAWEDAPDELKKALAERSLI